MFLIILKETMLETIVFNEIKNRDFYLMFFCVDLIFALSYDKEKSTYKYDIFDLNMDKK